MCSDRRLLAARGGRSVLPTAELHVHLEGTLEAELFVELAARNGVALPSTDPDVLRRRYRFSDLESFLALCTDQLAVLRTAEDFHDLASAYLRRASIAGVRHAEMSVDLQSHVARGVPSGAVFEGITAARIEAAAEGITSGLLLCFLRDLGPDAAMSSFEAALPYRQALLGVGLDSAELGHPPSLFREVFLRAEAEGLHRVAHAGEQAGPDYVWEALDVLGVERIDHGNRALEDLDLVARLREQQMPLTVCPLSNLALHTAPPSLADHPLPVMLDEGLNVSLHSGDPAYVGGYLDDAVLAMRDALELSESTLALLAGNAIRSSFAPLERKTELLLELDEAVRARC
jgi:adenosine deaminase